MSDNLKVKVAHLSMVQGTIGRMATGSFTIKGYVVALLVALLIAYSRESLQDGYWFILYFPFLLSYLDLYYLKKERGYRELYASISALDDGDGFFRMALSSEEKEKHSLLDGIKSPAIWPFYTLLFILVSFFLCAMK